MVANDFGRKNLYHNLGRRDGRVTFEDVAAQAGVEDHAAGMSALFFDYDGDGLSDIYAGQMWSDNGLRVTASPAFMPDAPAEVRALYRHHAQGNSLLRNRGDGTFEDVSLPARANMGRWSWSTGALDFDCDGWEDLYAVNGMVTRDSSGEDLDWFFWGGIVARSPLTRATGTPYDAAWRAMNRLMAGARSPATSATCSCATTARAASTTSRARSGSTSTRTAGRSPCWTPTATATRTRRCSRPLRAAAAAVPQRLRDRGATLRRCGWPARRATGTPSARG